MHAACIWLDCSCMSCKSVVEACQVTPSLPSQPLHTCPWLQLQTTHQSTVLSKFAGAQMVLSQPGEHFTATQLRALQSALESKQQHEPLGDLLQAMAMHGPAVDAFVRQALVLQVLNSFAHALAWSARLTQMCMDKVSMLARALPGSFQLS